jgi:uncharacterized protein (DUF486 family)
MTTILLLTLSNIFMTFAWYGHLKYRHAPLFKVIVVSWLPLSPRIVQLRFSCEMRTFRE